jgi:poly-gamma-glutamate synthesis protein (capsule biosynthesis protein)
MTGRGIDQVLPHPSAPELHESYVKDARSYISIAERRNGPITHPLGFDDIWGDALEELAEQDPDFRIINLETSVTTSDERWQGKTINYRMHPGNVPCLSAAGVDCCVLANNHVLDWGYQGLRETLGALHGAGIQTVGAGADLEEASAAAQLIRRQGGRVLVFSFATPSSGVPAVWSAREDRPGVNLLVDYTYGSVERIAGQVAALKQPGDIAIVSIHWGGNWGYRIPDEQRQFAHQLIDRAGVDIVHGHSSHHPKGIEVYRNRPILYGCGDFLNDYEGIEGHAAFRSDLVLMYFPTLDHRNGQLVDFTITPMQIKRFRLNRVSGGDADWIHAMLNREGEALGTRVEAIGEGRFRLSATG